MFCTIFILPLMIKRKKDKDRLEQIIIDGITVAERHAGL